VLTKILIFVGVVVGVFVVARMGASSATGPKTIFRGRSFGRKKPKVKQPDEMKPCHSCGAYIPKGETCTCGDTPTP
jgi:hypothetical protein